MQLRRRVGMVFQRPTPSPTMSIYDNVAAGFAEGGMPKQELMVWWNGTREAAPGRRSRTD